MNEDNLTLGKKLTIKAREAERKPVKERKTSGMQMKDKHVRGQKKEQEERRAQGGACKSSPADGC